MRRRCQAPFWSVRGCSVFHLGDLGKLVDHIHADCCSSVILRWARSLVPGACVDHERLQSCFHLGDLGKLVDHVHAHCCSRCRSLSGPSLGTGNPQAGQKPDSRQGLRPVPCFVGLLLDRLRGQFQGKTVRSLILPPPHMLARLGLCEGSGLRACSPLGRPVLADEQQACMSHVHSAEWPLK